LEGGAWAVMARDGVGGNSAVGPCGCVVVVCVYKECSMSGMNERINDKETSHLPCLGKQSLFAKRQQFD